MLLKNFGAYCAVAFTNNDLTEGIKCTTGDFPANTYLKRMPRQLNTLYGITNADTYTSNAAGGSTAYWYFIFGDGTTPPTIDDYKLSGDIVVPTMVSGTASASSGSNGITFQMTVINNTETPMTIGEIGICNVISSGGCVMLTRDVLLQPVVLQAGASKGFQIFIDTQSFVANASQA